jgi:O-antigen/teichoic acid export membrane protein
MVVNTVLMIVGAMFGNILYGYQRVDLWKICVMIQLLVNMALTVLFLYLGFGLVGVACASILGTGVMSVLYLFFIYHGGRYGLAVSYRLANLRMLKEIMPYSIRSFVLGITSQVLYFTDNIVIGVILGSGTVALYSIAYRLCFLVTYVFSVISTTLFPRFSNLYALGRIEELRVLFLRVTKISVGIMTPLAICLFLYGKQFIGLWVGNENFIGMKVISVLIIMDFFHAFGTTPGLLLQGIGKNQVFMFSETVNAVLNIVVSIILVKQVGAVGAAIGTLAAHILTSCWVVPLLACRYVGLSIPQYLKAGIIPPLLMGVPTVGLVLLLQDRLFMPDNYISLGLNSLIVITCYAVIYVFFGSSKVERKMYVKFLFRRDSAWVER